MGVAVGEWAWDSFEVVREEMLPHKAEPEIKQCQLCVYLILRIRTKN